MKKGLVALIGTLAFLAGGCDTGGDAPPPIRLPAGAHFDLALIGVPPGRFADWSDVGDRAVFMPLEGDAKLLLSHGPFAVLDENGTDGSAAFQLPDPEPKASGATSYAVWIRAEARPASTSPCAAEPDTDDLYCDAGQIVLVRDTGRPSFSNAAKDLLSVYADLDNDGLPARYPLFDEALADSLWRRNERGLKVAQLRFYDTAPRAP